MDGGVLVPIRNNNQNIQDIESEDSLDSIMGRVKSDGRASSSEAKKKRWEKDYALPPCRICGAKGTGFHYGVNTCEACKSFFGRSLNKQDELVCSRNQRCLLRPLSRRMCSRCRFQKCVEVGMSIEGVTFGRYTFAKRLTDIKEVKMLGEGKSCNESETSDSDLSTPGAPGINDPEVNPPLKTNDSLDNFSQKPMKKKTRKQRSRSARYSARDSARDSALDSAPDSVPDEPKYALPAFPVDSPMTLSPSTSSPMTSPMTSPLASPMTSMSLSPIDYSISNSPRTTVGTSPEKIRELQNLIDIVTDAGKKNSYILERNYEEVNKIQRELLLNYGVKMSIYEDMAIVYQGDNRIACFNSVFSIMEKYLQRVVKFAKAIPTFKGLPMIDQITLVKDSFPDLKAFSLYRYVNAEEGTWDNVCHVNKIFGEQLADGVVRMSRRMQALDLTAQEMDLLRALVIFNADGCDVVEAETVRRTQDNLIESMQHLLEKNHPNDSLVFARIIAVLTEMRSFREASRAYYSRVIVENMKGNSFVEIPTIFQEMLSPQ